MHQEATSYVTRARPAFFRLVPFYFVLMTAGSFLSLGKNFLFANVLTVAAFGYFSLFNAAITNGANFIHLGLLNGLNRELPVCIGLGNEQRALKLRNMALLAIGAILALLFLPYATTILVWEEDIQAKTVLLAAYPAVSVMVLFQITALELRGRQMLVPFSISYLMQGVFTMAAGLAGGEFFGLKGVIAAVILGSVFSTGAAWFFWLDRLRFVRLEFSEIKYLLRIGFPLLVSTVCGSLLLSMDKFFVAGLYGFEDLGYYQFASLIFIGGQAFAGIIAQWITPQVLYDHGRGVTPENNLHRVLKLMGGILALFLVFWYPFIRTSSYLIDQFFSQYVEAIPYLSIFYVAAGFTTINLAGVILNALNKQKLIMTGAIAVLLAVVPCYLVAVWLKLSLITFAWILLGGQFSMVAINLFLVYKCLRQRKSYE